MTNIEIINGALKSKDREVLVDAILTTAGDEYETVQDMELLAKLTFKELKEELKSIKEYHEDYVLENE